jgi:hypothetical protein
MARGIDARSRIPVLQHRKIIPEPLILQ